MFTLAVKWHFVWAIICLVSGYYYVTVAIKNSRKSEASINLSIVLTMFAILIGGRLGYGLIEQTSVLLRDPLGYFAHQDWGATFTIRRPIRWYGLLYALSFIIGSVIGSWVFRREGKPLETLDRLVLYLAIGTIVGGRLGHCIFYNPGYYFSDPVRILKVWEGGLASHGGGIGLLLATWYYTKTTKGFRFFWVFDRATIMIAVGACLIRIGNFMNSEILGKRTDSAFGIVFARVDSVPRHPAQLYESACYFLIFLILLWLYRYKSRNMAPGYLTGTGFVITFSARFLIEFVKEKQVATESDLILSMGQWLSIPMILFGAYILWRSYRSVGK